MKTTDVMKKVIPIISCLLLIGCMGCDYGNGYDQHVQKISVELSSGMWTYISFAKGEVVGTSLFGSDDEDARWAARTDWDIAVCGDMIRTNSGTSGSGSGGILRIDGLDFSDVDEAPPSGYMTDSNDVIVR